VLRELRLLQSPGEEKNGETAEEWSAGELAALGETPIALTHELDGLMKTQTLLAAQRRPWTYIAAAAIGALLVGGVIGFASRESFLLADQAGNQAIPQKVTGQAQYQYALLTDEGNDVDAWKAVLNWHPNDEPWPSLARQALAMLYLQRKEYDQALPLFRQLAEMPKVNKQQRARGLAGQVVIYAIQKNDRELADKITELMENSDLMKAIPPEFSREIPGILERSRARFDESARVNMERFVKGLETGSQTAP
jgi:hypothetical protein